MNYTTIYFKIENKNCEQKGYVEIYEDDEYMPEFYYWNYNTGYQCQETVYHKNEMITGLTDEQISEIEDFKELVNNTYVDWVNDVILNSEEDEHETYEKGNLKIIINGDD